MTLSTIRIPIFPIVAYSQNTFLRQLTDNVAYAWVMPQFAEVKI